MAKGLFNRTSITIWALCIAGLLSSLRPFLEVAGVSGLVSRLEFWAFIFFLTVLIVYTVALVVQAKREKKSDKSEEPNYISEIKKLLEDIKRNMPKS